MRGIIIRRTKIFLKVYNNGFIGRLFHTSVYCLKQELNECDFVLDLGCGSGSPIKYCKVIKSIGVDGFRPSIKTSKEKKIHSDYILSDIKYLNFRPASVDVVMLIEVLEHLPQKDGELLLDKAETWAKKKVIISSPNGFFSQHSMNENQYFKHISGWEVEKMTQRGYNAHGLAGLKSLRKGNESEEEADGGLLSTIRFRPKLFWLLISELIQIVIYYFPKAAFEVFYVKRLEGDN